MRLFAKLNLSLAVLSAFCLVDYATNAADLTQNAVNHAEFQNGAVNGRERSPIMLRAQVMLDRAHVSPGVIDGRRGENTAHALAAYEQMHGMKPDGKLDKAVWQSLTRKAAPALVEYTISKDDTDGPFIDHVPGSLQAMAKLDHLAYTSPAELLAEKFHMDEGLLKQINKGADFGKAGTTITVANVRGRQPRAEAMRVEANKQREAVTAYDADGHVIAYYPATVGSKSLPSPSGRVKVKQVVQKPKYHYHPDLNFKGVPDKRFTVAAGPNNPVGVVWIGLDKEGYGIHGTAEPAEIGKEMSHGCVRLTNWDAEELSRMVKPGTPVIFTKKAKPLPGLGAASGSSAERDGAPD